MSNFNFLKTLDKNLFEIISEAEKLYRDEYFEQSMTQTRRFGEIVCKNILGSNRTSEKTFDDMLATLKDRATNSIQEKELIEDLYFIKREGNTSTHACSVKKDGIIALECLQRAFEVALNYAVYYKKSNSNLLHLQFDTELLVTGKKTKKSLSEKYLEEKNKTTKKTKKQKKTTEKNTKKLVLSSKKNNLWFKILLSISAIISTVLVLTIYILSFAH